MAETESASLVMTVDEAARALRISRNSAFSRVHDGSLPSIRLGRRLLVPRKALEEMLAGHGARIGDKTPLTGGQSEAMAGSGNTDRRF